MNPAEMQVVVFELAGEEYALELARVHEVVRGPGRLPLREPAPPAVGMIRSSAGEAAPVVRARERLGLPEGPPAEHTLLVSYSPALRFGVEVDAVREVTSLPGAAVLPPPPLFRGHGTGAVRALLRLAEDRLVVLLALAALLTEEEARRLATAAPLEDAAAETETLRRER